MLTPNDLHGYQTASIEHQLAHEDGSMLWVDMSLGKTVVTLTSILERKDGIRSWGVLVVGPIRVCQAVWRQEAEKWTHLKGKLTFSLITGSKKERERALFTRADIYLVNYESLGWLVSMLEHHWLRHGKYPPFNRVVWDEVSKMKNTRLRQGADRGKAAIKLMPYIHGAEGLTGTPASNGLLDLFGQYLVTDKGQRLGTSFDRFQRRFFYQTDWQGYKWAPMPGADEAIRDLIGDITLSLHADDYLELPPYVINDIELDLPTRARNKYKQLESDFLLSFTSGAELEIENTASLFNRCLQFANGACYTAPESPKWEKLHDVKLDALEDIVEESAGKPILVLYQFQHDAQRIKAKFKQAVVINSRIPEQEFNDICVKWNAGLLPILVGHPACVHPKTEVLTENRGWVKIIEVAQTDRVFDGVEFVSHDGCHYSGYREVIEVFGVTMTPDHKILVDGEWMEARYVRDRRDYWEKALQNPQTGSVGPSEMSKMRGSLRRHRKTETYDLLNCGPRHRFLIRNDAGEMVLSHNSIGHGLNLQAGSSRAVWFGLTWALDLYDQSNARLRRQGQTADRVVIDRLLVKGTLEYAVLEALNNKAQGERAIRDAIKAYAATA